MNIGYSISKLNAKIDSMGEQGGKAYCLDKIIENKVDPLPDLTNLNKYGSMVVFQDKIHMLGGDGYATRHEVWDGTSWTMLEQAPMYIQGSCVIVFNNAIHVFSSTSSAYAQYHYKYDGEKWTKLSNTVANFYDGGACHDGNYIYLMTNSGAFFKYDESSDTYTSLTNLTSNTGAGVSLLYHNGEIRYFRQTYQQKYNLSTNKWTSVSQTGLSNGSRIALCMYNDELYGIPTFSSAQGIYKYDFNTSVWEQVYNDKSTVFDYPSIVVYKGFIHYVQGKDTKTFARYKCGTLITGNVEKNTYIHVPEGKNIIYGNIEKLDNGYIAKSDTEFVIGV